MKQDTPQPRWAKSVLTWAVSKEAGVLVGVVSKQAWKLWTDVCGIETACTSVFGSADVCIGWVDLGPHMVATSDMPPPDNQLMRLFVHLNKRHEWAWLPFMRGLDPLRALAHEFGHVLGLNHGPEGSLMHHEYQAGVVKPQAWDVREVVERYGKPHGQ